MELFIVVLLVISFVAYKVKKNEIVPKSMQDERPLIKCFSFEEELHMRRLDKHHQPLITFRKDSHGRACPITFKTLDEYLQWNRRYK